MRQLALGVLTGLLGLLCIQPDPFPSYVRAVYQVNVRQTVGLKPYAFLYQGHIPEDSAWTGTAFAVTSNGMLMTVRHAVDLGDGSPEFCGPAGMFVDRITLDLEVKDTYGQRWKGEASSVATPDGFCDMFGRVNLAWKPRSEAQVLISNGYADLALLRIRARGLAHIDLKSDIQPAEGDAVTATGWPRDVPITSTGFVVDRCTTAWPYSEHQPVRYQPTIQTSAEVVPGMSGGPVVIGNTLAGVTARMRLDVPLGVGVTGSYAAQWYEWVTGKTTVMPAPECPR